MISRTDALKLLKKHNTETSLVYHSLETEAVMEDLAKKLDQDPQVWGLTGLLHDLDYTSTKNDISRHGLASIELLKGKIPEYCLKAIKKHNYSNNLSSPPSEPLDFALRCGETVTGLISANAMVRPGKMKGMKPKSLKKKMKSKSFAANVNRETIKECQKLGLELSEFFRIAIAAVYRIADEVKLS
ncbi:MAG: HDIG domain-containing protein [Deltaproteobacteria bacterium]|jgi:putative nucleotidyltransferase with HDIG domain|nr:HDIG domain-containing protein [Deltaproteobacteria bacterium]